MCVLAYLYSFMTMQFLSTCFEWLVLVISWLFLEVNHICTYLYISSCLSIIFFPQKNGKRNRKKATFILTYDGPILQHRWEVPFPRMIKSLYTSIHSVGTDPRFMKLEPVFRCLNVKCGDRQRYTDFWIFSLYANILFFISCSDYAR